MASLCGIHQCRLLLHYWSPPGLPSWLQSKIGSEGTLGRHDMWISFAGIDSVGHNFENQLEQGGKLSISAIDTSFPLFSK